LEALRIAFAISKCIELDPDFEPDDETYGNLVKAGAYLLPDGKERMNVITSVLTKCIDAGQFSSYVVRYLRRGITSDCVLPELLWPFRNSIGVMEFEGKIPPAWCRNVKNKEFDPIDL